jgi:hypothetical protein
MSERINASICLTDLGDKARANHSAITTGNNGKKYANITIWVNDTKDQFDNDVSIQLNSKQESREAEGKVYVGKGKTNRVPDITGMPSATITAGHVMADPNDLPF